MTWLLIFLASNAIVATCLLVVGLLADRFLRWPAVCHLIWAAVLLQLLLPPLVSIGVALPQAVTETPAGTTFAASQFATEQEATDHPLLLPTSGSRPVSLAAALTAVELIGAAIFLGLALTRSVRLSRVLRWTEDSPDTLHERARLLADELGLRKLPRIRVTSERIVPMLVALPVPTVVLSRPLIESLRVSEVDALLAHELAHARRGDAWLRPVELLATALYWWLPTVWIARRRLRRAEEAACDALVLSARPTARRAYAECLLKTIELTTPAAAATFVTGSANSRQMKERITMILEQSDYKAPRGALTITAVFALLAILVGPTLAPAQPAVETGRDEPLDGTSAEAGEQRAIGFRMEHELIELRLQAYHIENRIQRVDLSNEMARIAEGIQVAEANGNEREAVEMQRSLERLMLERERLDVDMHIRQLETELALRDLALHEQVGGGAPSPAGNQ
jgi:beta-lactamase regulating signal transducer with metallopeptidase domain